MNHCPSKLEVPARFCTLPKGHTGYCSFHLGPESANAAIHHLKQALLSARLAIGAALMAQEDHESYRGSPEERAVLNGYAAIDAVLSTSRRAKP